MIDDLALRWVVTVLFVLSAAGFGYAGIAVGRTYRVVCQGLHFIMAVAMAVMAWPNGADLPTTAPMTFFLMATAWFVGVGVVEPGHRIANGYHAAMMLAMVWMYAVMNGRILPGQGSGGGHHEMAHMDMPMPEMDTAGHAGLPAWINAVDWFWTVGFSVAAVCWLYRYFTARQARRALPAHESFWILAQAMMAAGMAIMFGAMLSM